MNRQRLALAVLVVVACGDKDKPRPTPEKPIPAAARARPKGPAVASTGKGLHFRLSEGDGAAAEDRPPAAAAEPLGEAETTKLVAALPPLPPADARDFALRPASQPPPKTGEVVTTPFPPPTAGPAAPGVAAQADAAPKLVRHAPEGDVPIVPHLSVTFDQPMIAVGSHADSLKGELPVKLSPEPPGHFRWVGTRTLLFEPDGGRFPGATEYTVSVPATAKSAAGKPVAAASSWTFRTPTPTVVEQFPEEGPIRLDQVFYLRFDQKIDPKAVLATITLDADKLRPIRLATPAEIAADENLAALSAAAEPGTWLAFRAVDLLPADYRIDVKVGPGTPSLEGPRKTPSPHTLQVRTYEPFKLVERRCGWNGPCRPEMGWQLRFNNPIDVEKLDTDTIVVEPKIPGLTISASGPYLHLTGRKKANTKYTVTLPASLPDEFGQTLRESRKETFDVGAAEPWLSGPNRPVITVDPGGKPVLSVYSVNQKKLHVTLSRVGPADWGDYWTYLDEYYRRDRVPRMPGQRKKNDDLEVKGSLDELTETRIDLSPALEDGFGHVLVEVTDTRAVDRWEKQRVTVWVQVTKLGVTAIGDSLSLRAWVTDLATGAPVAGASVALSPATSASSAAPASVSTDADGVARLGLPDTSVDRGRLLVATRGADVAFVAEQQAIDARSPDPNDDYFGYGYYGGGGQWVRRERQDRVLWYVEDDRSMYRPGEEVHVKGWLRRIGRETGLAATTATGVTWTAEDEQARELARGEAKIGALGGFDLAFKLPGTPNLGHARLRLRAVGESGQGTDFVHGFQIQEFRRPEFQVAATVPEGPFVLGGHAEVSVAATYYAGGGLPGAPVVWSVNATPGSFSPPGRSDYSFGEWTPWWWGPGIGTRSGRGRGRKFVPPEPAPTAGFPARTSPLGGHVLRIDFDEMDEPRPTAVTAQAAVTDVNRQEWAANASLLVHPADRYVGLKTSRMFVQEGQPLDVDALVVDLDGKATPGATVKLRATRTVAVWKKGEWSTEEKDEILCEKTTAGDQPVRCELRPKTGGQWKIRAEIVDGKGRRNVSSLTRWVAGGPVVPEREVKQQLAQLVPDKKEYRPGETAEMLLTAPFAPAEVFISLVREGVVSTERRKLDGPSTVIKVAVGEADIGGLTVRVDLVGQAERPGDDGRASDKLPRRPAYAAAQLELAVPPLTRKLGVTAVPRARGLAPGGETDVDVAVVDASGQPAAGAVVALVVVDEAVLALSGRTLGDPLSAFHPGRVRTLSEAHSRAQLLLANLADLDAPEGAADGFGEPVMQAPMAPGGVIGTGAGGGGYGVGSGKGASRNRGAAPPKPAAPMKKAKEEAREESAAEDNPSFALRTDFNPLATWAPEVKTDAAGKAVVHVKVPDNLTRYRIMAVAVLGDRQFGAGEDTVTARLPLMVRPAAPRFLNFGDKFELGVVLHNQTEEPMSVDLVARAQNATVGDGRGRRVIVPANDRVEVRLPGAADRAGTAVFQLAAVGAGRHTDAQQVSLPVWTPATSEAFATYGELDGPAVSQKIAPPGDAFTQFGGLQITTSSTALASLTDAVLYLVSYRYECSEQLSSRILAVAALKDVLTAFKAEGLPPPEEMAKAMARDIDRLAGRQSYDGGFLMWDDSRETWPWGTLHVTHALLRAKQKGYPVPAPMLERALAYVREIESHLPGWWNQATRRAHRAYAAYVLELADDGAAVGKAAALLAEAKPVGLSMDDLGFLLYALAGRDEAAIIVRHVENKVSETAGAARFTVGYDKEQGYLILASSRRADGILLEALIAAQPKHDLIPKLVRGLMNDRKRGHWGNTQENAFVLLAMDRYFRTYEKATPSFVARAWLGSQFAGEHAFRGRTTESHEVAVPMAALGTGAQDLVIGKDGPGRLYYRIGMTYAPKSLAIDPADHGFAVERTYEPVDDPKDVTRDADGTWHVRAGARVRVRLTMAAEAPRSFVMLVDPMPAGFEAMNAALAITADIPADPDQARQQGGPYWWWRGPWYEHQNMRDERVEAFTTRLYEGVYTYSYVARATSYGQFVVPPTKAEEMYSPETFGRAGSDRVIVE